MKKILALVLLGVFSVSAFAGVGNTIKSVSGTWMVTNNGKLNPNMKLILSPKGTFKFVGSNYSSSGNFKVNGDAIRLDWTKVDGEAVKPGQMKKVLTLAADGTFVIDRYTYSRKA